MPKKNTTTSPSTKPRAKSAAKKMTAVTKRVAKRAPTKKRKPAKTVSILPSSISGMIEPVPVAMTAAPLSVSSFAATPRARQIPVHTPHPEARLLLIGEYYLILVLCAIIGIGCMYAILAWI